MKSKIKHYLWAVARTLCRIYVVLVVVGGIALGYASIRDYLNGHHHRYDPVNSIANAASYGMTDVAYRTGIVYRDANRYFASAYGKPFKHLSLAKGWRMRDITAKSTESVDLYAVCVKVSARHGSKMVSVKDQASLTITKPGITERILLSATAGSNYWKDSIQQINKDDSVLCSYKPQVVSLPFVYPRNDKELAVYKEWLETEVIGSRGLLVDGWKHEIKLGIIQRQNKPILAASSCGRDGKWNTKDDVTIKRDMTTGETIGCNSD